MRVSTVRRNTSGTLYPNFEKTIIPQIRISTCSSLSLDTHIFNEKIT